MYSIFQYFFIPFKIKAFDVWSGNVTAAVPKCARNNDGLFILGSQSVVIRSWRKEAGGYDT